MPLCTRGCFGRAYRHGGVLAICEDTTRSQKANIGQKIGLGFGLRLGLVREGEIETEADAETDWANMMQQAIL